MSAPTAEPEARPGRAGRLLAGLLAFCRRFYRWVATGSLSMAFHGMWISVVGLTVLGCTMVLSASSVEQLSKASSPYMLFVRQLLFAGLGVVVMFILSKVPLTFWKRRAVVMCVMLAALFSLVLVLTPLGVEVEGNRNWLRVGSFQVQPSEFGKLALVLWCAWGLAKNRHVATSVRDALIPSIYGLLLIGLLVGLGGDAGTAIIFVLIYGGALWFARAPRKIFTLSALAALMVTPVVIASSPARIHRVIGWLVPGQCGSADQCYQSDAGLAALASGSWLGLGLGQSRQKYNYVPEAHNDYIFAILGEEMGFLGALVVILLYAVFALSVARVILRSSDRFVRIAAGGILAWFIGQATVNIGMVTGLLPVIGVPLPFISYGRSALLMCLTATGFMMSLTRSTPTHPAIELEALEGPEPRTARG